MIKKKPFLGICVGMQVLSNNGYEMGKHRGLGFINGDVKNLKEDGIFTLPTVDMYQWDPKIKHAFFTKDWGIFHGAYFKEPFGYSIFEAVDYGKLPIINKDWGRGLDYKYRVNTKNEFDNCIKEILKDSHETRSAERNKLINYMKKFDNKSEWVDKIRTQILSFY